MSSLATLESPLLRRLKSRPDALDLSDNPQMVVNFDLIMPPRGISGKDCTFAQRRDLFRL